MLLAVTAGGLYWWFTRVPQIETPTIEPATLAPFSSAADDDDVETDEANLEPAQAVNANETDTETVAADAEVVAAEVATSAPVATIDPLSSPPSDLPQVEIELSYSGDCWTEVSDASGRRLFYDLGQSGRTITLSGDSPLRVVLGDSANVSVKVDGNAYSIPASARTGRLARLTLSQP